MILNFSDINSAERYKVMSRTIIPRPIAWIVTESQGVVNIAPFSYFTPLSSKPATVVVSIGHKSDGSKKDTLANILETGKATICFVKEEHKEIMDNTGESLPKEKSEAEYFNIETEKPLESFPPIIKDVECALFCNFMKTVELEGQTIPVLLEVESAYYEDSKIDEDLKIFVKHIGRVGKGYGKIEDI